jgi:hypothetical protein
MVRLKATRPTAERAHGSVRQLYRRGFASTASAPSPMWPIRRPSLRSGFRLCSRLEGRPQKVENRLEQIGIRPRASMPVRYTQAKGVSARPTAGVAFHLATPRSSAQCVNGRAYEIVSVHRQSRPVPNVAPVEHINMFIERRFDGRSTSAVSAANSKILQR